ncbi:hypothetical protein B0A48_14238 [Cryoendolithus antarcticus]|uniref:Uncharacterized protein n=1 Tax=Cryoendolithus antarcticus TaxID=1507870 RepID=A0A1V8SLJ5_9PEZI|nr:hypothetical protein B0A48_14238 [Cryoendolithus antarcticus]
MPVRHSYRQPRTANSKDFWYCPPNEWSELLIARESDDPTTRKLATGRLQKKAKVAKLIESDHGITAPDFAKCKHCRSAGLPCRVARDGRSKVCARYVHDRRKCEAVAITHRGIQELREMEVVSKRTRSVEIVDELEWAMPKQDLMKRKMSGAGEDRPAPRDVPSFLASRQKQTSPPGLLANPSPSKKRKTSGIGEHRAFHGSTILALATHQSVVASREGPLHSLMQPANYGDAFRTKDDMPAGVVAPLPLPHKGVPDSPEIPLATLRRGRNADGKMVREPDEGNGMLTPPAEEGPLFPAEENVVEQSSGERARDLADIEISALKAEATLLRAEYERQRLCAQAD